MLYVSFHWLRSTWDKVPEPKTVLNTRSDYEYGVRFKWEKSEENEFFFSRKVRESEMFLNKREKARKMIRFYVRSYETSE